MSAYQDACVRIAVSGVVDTRPESRPIPRASSTDGPRRHATRRIVIEMQYASVLCGVCVTGPERPVAGQCTEALNPPRAAPARGSKSRLAKDDQTLLKCLTQTSNNITLTKKD
jgi:hypothetical protein